jgi:hypothetical protein
MESKRIISVKYLKGKDISPVERINEGFTKETLIKRVVTENSPREVKYEKSEGRIIDFLKSLNGEFIV